MDENLVEMIDAYFKLLKKYQELEQKYFDLQKENEKLRYKASEYRQAMFGGMFL